MAKKDILYRIKDAAYVIAKLTSKIYQSAWGDVWNLYMLMSFFECFYQQFIAKKKL